MKFSLTVLACLSFLLPEAALVQAKSHSRSEDTGSSVDYDNDNGHGGDPPAACGCHECTQDVLDRVAGEYTCGDRIGFLMGEPHFFSEEEACIRVARTEFRLICGPECDPGRCDGRELPAEEIPSSYCGCKHCQHRQWQTITPGPDQHTCGARISYLADIDGLPMTEACNIVGGQEFPDDDLCGLCDPYRCEPIMGPGETHCGCHRCTEAVWQLEVDGSTCGERIEFLQQDQPHLYPTEVDACRKVAGEEYPHQCGSNCDPHSCDAPLRQRTPLYCFPEFDERVRFRNVWGNKTIEVKESKVEPSGVCGPQDNKFKSSTVERVSTNEIKLQFKKIGDHWVGAEVRLRLPNADMPFRYGTYSFSVESIKVINTNTNEVVSKNVLPPSLVLSLHTWDATENFAIHENWNHQVGIDISRFGDADGTDARFAVQPATEFNTYNFYTGEDYDYKQAPRIHSFDWNPANIEFYSDSGEVGESFSYSTQRAMYEGETDYTQCLPADVEIRMNLWNINGTDRPMDMWDNDVVEVIIDNFEYHPSGLEYVPDGGACSKDCMCAPYSRCYGFVCTAEIVQYEILAATATATAGGSSDNMQVILGFSVFGGCVVALAFITFQRMKERKETSEEAANFNLSPSAVKG